MKPTWVLSEEERQRRFRKNREKHEHDGPTGPARKGGRSRANSLNELTGDFELMDGGLVDSLPGLLLLEQAAEARESVPVILEKQQQSVVVKSETNGGVVQQGGNHFFGNSLGSSLPHGEPSKTSNSFYVKSEPKPVYSPGPFPDQKPCVSVPTQPRVLYVTTASQNFAAPPQPFASTRLSQSQARMPPPPLPPFLPSTPSVIVRATTSLPHTRTYDYQASSVPEYTAPETSFPLEVGSFATVEAELCPGQTFHHQFPTVLTTEEYERQLEDGLEYVDSVYSDSEDDEEPGEEERRKAAEMRERMLQEPEFKFTNEEQEQLNLLVKQHDERYRSVNFGEELIKEMIMCRYLSHGDFPHMIIST